MGYTLIDDGAGDAPAPKPGRYRLIEDGAEATPTPANAKLKGSTLGGLVMGLRDPIDAGAQMLIRALPDSVVRAGNALNNKLADIGFPVSRLDTAADGGTLSGIVAGSQANPAAPIDRMVQAANAEYDASRKAAGRDGIDLARIAGNIANPINRLVPMAGAASTLGVAGRAAAQGAISGAMTPVTDTENFAGSKADQIGIGALAGAGGGVVAQKGMNALSRLVSPRASTNPNVSLLTSEGVEPTIGQTLGGRWNAAEEKLQSLPIVGDMIARRRGEALRQFNTAAINRAAGKVGEAVEGSGQSAIKEAGNLISDAYERGKAALGHFQIDSQGANELSTLQSMAANLPQKEQGVFNRLWETVQGEISPNGSILPEAFKRIDSKLGQEGARFSKSSDAYQQQLGDAITEFQRVMTENAKRANPDAARMLNDADAAWANLVRIEAAGKAAKNAEGVFTPAQLNSAIQQADSSVRGRAVARGNALMQDLGNAGQQVLGNKIPDSGTAGRLALGSGAVASGFINPAIPLGLVGGAAMYSRPVQNALRYLLTARPAGANALASNLEAFAPRLAPASVPLAFEARK